MSSQYQYTDIPRSRIATFDVYAMGMKKHHITALLEFDVTDARRKLQEIRRSGSAISLNAWLTKVISQVLEQHPHAASFLHNKRKRITFKDHNFSFLVEKQVGDQKVPLPMVIERVNEKDARTLSEEIEAVKNQVATKEDIVLAQKPSFGERLYYHMPGFIRRMIWRYIIHHPRMAYGKMGNVSITSLGMMGRINGWFIHKSIHPLSFGIGSVLQKPAVVNNEIKIREILNMTVLVDHDVIDGAPMARLLKALTQKIEEGPEV